jgi:hypothetical protein
MGYYYPRMPTRNANQGIILNKNPKYETWVITSWLHFRSSADFLEFYLHVPIFLDDVVLRHRGNLNLCLFRFYLITIQMARTIWQWIIEWLMSLRLYVRQQL